jgi:hypothetical protein
MPDDCIHLYEGSDNSVEIRNLIDKTNGDAEVTTATVELIEFQDAESGTPIVNVVLPLSMASVGGTNTYRGNIPDDAVLTEGQRVDMTVEADDGAARKRLFRRTAIVVV